VGQRSTQVQIADPLIISHEKQRRARAEELSQIVTSEELKQKPDQLSQGWTTSKNQTLIQTQMMMTAMITRGSLGKTKRRISRTMRNSSN
jgi:hypothetical protein